VKLRKFHRTASWQGSLDKARMRAAVEGEVPRPLLTPSRVSTSQPAFSHVRGGMRHSNHAFPCHSVDIPEACFTGRLTSVLGTVGGVDPGDAADVAATATGVTVPSADPVEAADHHAAVRRVELHVQQVGAVGRSVQSYCVCLVSWGSFLLVMCTPCERARLVYAHVACAVDCIRCTARACLLGSC
jgi:hypothetical protein